MEYIQFLCFFPKHIVMETTYNIVASSQQEEIIVENNPATAPTLPESSRKSLWDMINKTPGETPGAFLDSTESETIVPLQSQAPLLPIAELPNEARESVEAKLLKQLAEMTYLLEQQTSILQSQQKLLENLTDRQKSTKKRKPGVKSKIKSLIHKGKIIWSVL